MAIINLQETIKYRKFNEQITIYLNNKAKGTKKNYNQVKYQWELWCEQNNKPVLELNSENITNFIRSLTKQGHETKKHSLTIMCVLVDLLHLSDISNPYYIGYISQKNRYLKPQDVILDMKTEVNRPRLTLEQVEHYLDNVLIVKPEMSELQVFNLHRDKVAVAMMFFAGLRLNEVTTVQWSHIGANSITVMNKKENRIDTASIFRADKYIQHWREYLMGKFGKVFKYVLISSYSRGLSLRDATRPISNKPVIAAIQIHMSNYFGFHLKTHSARYTLARDVYDKTHDLDYVCELLRHVNSNVTRLYIKLASEGQAELNNEKLNRLYSKKDE
jgi:site-specific recombinase XerC